MILMRPSPALNMARPALVASAKIIHLNVEECNQEQILRLIILVGEMS
jgi:hypothetical protein